jgi:hypothetical protein
VPFWLATLVVTETLVVPFCQVNVVAGRQLAPLPSHSVTLVSWLRLVELPCA